MHDDDIPLLRMKGIEKSFPGVKALKGVSLELYPGEVLGLVGENGAGKSTLMKVLGGAHRPDAGTGELQGEAVQIDNPVESKNLGISIIYQELNMIPAMTARENLILGRERTSFGFVKPHEEVRMAEELFAKVGLRVPLDALARDLSVAEQQGIEIAKALSLDAKILVMDEPTAALTHNEVEALFAIIGELKKRGIGIIYISHRLDEIFTITDRVTVLRDGESVGTRKTTDLPRPELIEMMVGRKMDQEFPPRVKNIGRVKFEARHLTRAGCVEDVSFSVRAGEIVGLVGLVGAGRTETVRLIFGADRRDAGEILLDGKSTDIRNPRDSIRSRIALLTEDRKAQGLVLIQSVRENFALPNLKQFSRLTFINRKKESAAFRKYVDSLRIKIPSQEQLAQNLSGGNQQKVVLAKWLQANCELVVFDEPTRGVDVGAKYEIYQIMNELAERGKAIVMISSELPEAIGMADRLLVMRDGKIVGEVTDPKHTTQAEVLKLAVGA
ncbi:MAG: sugar ABC transporter ATP-binding protein [Planctomycetaceae bacterium]|nr:sugar ABC transporter ATP-binding protein [Planctomycetaceae bacterium]